VRLAPPGLARWGRLGVIDLVEGLRFGPHDQADAVAGRIVLHLVDKAMHEEDTASRRLQDVGRIGRVGDVQDVEPVARVLDLHDRLAARCDANRDPYLGPGPQLVSVDGSVRKGLGKRHREVKPLIVAKTRAFYRLYDTLDGRGNRGAAARHSEATDEAGGGRSLGAAARAKGSAQFLRRARHRLGHDDCSCLGPARLGRPEEAIRVW
jgi:hypothetical protein